MSSAEVDEFLDSSTHSRIAEVRTLRTAILLARPDLTEHIKWNAPSFCIDGDDRVTFRLQPGDRVELVLHRGARRRTDVDGFDFPDPSGLIEWAAPDRGVVVVRDREQLDATEAEIVDLVGRWVNATAG